MGPLKLVTVVALAMSARAQAADLERWSSDIAEASVRFDIPEAWIRRVMAAESGGETRLGGRPIVSRKGAMGLMQLMPGTWREMRDVNGLGADPHEPHDNILAGAAYLRLLYDRFGYPGLFAAYNAGPARYADHLASGRPLPAETLSYVALVSRTDDSSHVSRGPARAPLFALLAPEPETDRREPSSVPAPARSQLFVPVSSAAGP